ncbi:hypothetical protein B7P43_G16317 [Cryptotermes secundus]|uniref:Uncharacterized protein n=1 Tax=Cryptotermes secundus TaxID=105785 RepID=A0A2J7PPM0_9NEOP|nr:hypothetical protein B7P43_G16317 [Cryptotermes secundus]
MDEDRMYTDNPLQWLFEVSWPNFPRGRLTLPIKWGLAKVTQCMSSDLLRH